MCVLLNNKQYRKSTFITLKAEALLALVDLNREGRREEICILESGLGERRLGVSEMGEGHRQQQQTASDGQRAEVWLLFRRCRWMSVAPPGRTRVMREGRVGRAMLEGEGINFFQIKKHSIWAKYILDSIGTYLHIRAVSDMDMPAQGHILAS